MPGFTSPTMEAANASHVTNKAAAEQLKLQIDMEKVIDDEKYDEILDELLSDMASQKSDLAGFDMFPSPTFEGFWNSGDDDEEVDELGSTQFADENDIANLSKLIDTVEVVSKLGKDMDNNENHTMLPEVQGIGKSDVNMFEEKVLGSPSRITMTNRSSIQRKSNDNTSIDPAQIPRSPLAMLNSVNISPEASVTEKNRRLSTGCIPESSKNPSLDFIKSLNYIATMERKDASPAAPACETKEVDINLQPSASTESLILNLDLQIRPFESHEKSTADPTIEKEMKTSDSKILSDTSTKGAIKSSEQEGTSSPSSKNDRTGKTRDISTVSPETKAIEGADPYEWAYNVWRRKGMMRGIPTDIKRTEYLPVPRANQKTANQKREVSNITTVFVQPVATRRLPKDRLSLPAKMGAPMRQKAKTSNGNGAGFSQLMSKWKSKSDENPNAHFLSPRNIRGAPLVRSTETGGDVAALDGVSTMAVAQEPVDPHFSTSASSTLQKDVCQEYMKTSYINPTSIKMESVDTTLSTSKQQSMPKASKQDQAWPTPTKNKNVLSRYLQKSTLNTAIPAYIPKQHGNSAHKISGDTNVPQTTSDLACPIVELSPLTKRTRSDETSTIPFLSPADDSLLDPREVMRHCQESSEHHNTLSRNLTSKVSTMVPCKEIFIIKNNNDYDDHASIAMDSHCLSAGGLPGIAETRADSMSFDSQSYATQLTFRIDTFRQLDSKVSAIAETSNDQTGAPPSYSDRPWNKDLLVQNVTTAMDKASSTKFACDCDYSLAMFSGEDEMVEFFLPLMTVTCACRKSKQLVNYEEPDSLENILRPWQTKFLKNFGIVKGDQLVKAYHRSAR